jgi:hypothetical protein
MAAKTKRSGDQKTRKPGKETSGWEKVGVYLSPDAAMRLMLASMKRGKDRSTILNSLVMAQLPAYTITVGSNDRLDTADDVSVVATSAA